MPERLRRDAVSGVKDFAQFLGLRDRYVTAQCLRVKGQGPTFLHGFHLLESCLLVVMRGIAENDGYNALVLEAGLWWRDVALIRTLSRYLRQIRIAFSQDYMWMTLRKHSGIAAQLTRLFQTRFDPRLGALGDLRGGQEDAIASEIEAALNKTLPDDLVTLADIQGMIHCHTTYSDGKHSVAEMASTAEAMGMKYLTITDHSPTAFYAT